MSFPLSLTPKARSILANVCGEGTALPSVDDHSDYILIQESCERTLIRLNDRSGLVDLLREILLRHGRFLSEAGGRDGFGHGDVYRIWWCDFVFCSITPFLSVTKLTETSNRRTSIQLCDSGMVWSDGSSVFAT